MNGPWLVVARTAQRIIAAHIHTTPKGRDAREAVLHEQWDDRLVTVKSYDLRDLLFKADKMDRKEIELLEELIKL